MYFVTTDTDVLIDKLFSRIFNIDYSSEKANVHIVKHTNLNGIFYNCKKVELPAHTVFINGNAFPDKGETFQSALEKSIQKGNGANFIHGNFNLIVFNKDLSKDNSFFIINDRHGTVPCFFTREDGVIQVSSILHLFLLDRENYNINEQSLLDYLCLGYTLPGESLWNAIRMLPEEKFLTVLPDNNQIILKNKHVTANKSGTPTPFQSLEECAKYFVEKLGQVISDELESIPISHMLLTGGSDTRVLLSCMNQKQRDKLSYRTSGSAYWSSTSNDVLVAKLIAEKFHLRHEVYSSDIKKVNKIVKYPQANQETQYKMYNDRWISGRFGSELFGGASFTGVLFSGYVFSERLDFFKQNLLDSLITSQDYKRIGSPWQRLKQRMLSFDSSVSKEGAFIAQMLLRSQFTSIYSTANCSLFIIPSTAHFFGPVFPYIDTRIIDFFLRCPREFLLNYSLYEYIFTYFSEKKLVEIPFHSNMVGFVESLRKINSDIISNIGTESKCDYKEYFEKNFSPSSFEGTFLTKLSNRDGNGVSEHFLSRICDLNCFLLGLKNR